MAHYPPDLIGCPVSGGGIGAAAGCLTGYAVRVGLLRQRDLYGFCRLRPFHGRDRRADHSGVVVRGYGAFAALEDVAALLAETEDRVVEYALSR